MTLTKSLLSVFAALALSTGAAFAGGSLSSSYDAGGPELLAGPELNAEDGAYFAQTEGAMTDPFTTAESGQMREFDVYYIVPMEVVEVEEIWLFPSGDSQMPQG